MHLTPESTTDYWIDDLFYVDYEASVLDTVKRLNEMGYKVIIKEHPSFYLVRKSLFYKSLLLLDCQILTPFEPTIKVFSLVDLVVVYNGSTGIEAVIHEKKVIKLTNSYYGDNFIPSLQDFKNSEKLKKGLGIKIVEKVLRSSFKTI